MNGDGAGGGGIAIRHIKSPSGLSFKGGERRQSLSRNTKPTYNSSHSLSDATGELSSLLNEFEKFTPADIAYLRKVGSSSLIFVPQQLLIHYVVRLLNTHLYVIWAYFTLGAELK